MEMFWLIAIFPLLIPWAFRFFVLSQPKRVDRHRVYSGYTYNIIQSVREITILEIVVASSLGLLIGFVLYQTGRWSKTHDTEVLNGQVTDKDSQRVSCQHSYACRCRPVSCGKNCTTTHCDTCYEHFYDVSWYVYTSINHTFEIDRIDRQGLGEPGRWTSTQIGEPIAITHGYTNWIKAVPESLFTPESDSAMELYEKDVPDYPLDIYDYWRLDRVLSIGVNADLREWNKKLSETLKTLGPQKQINAVILLTKIKDANYTHAVKTKWLTAKKNDAVIVIGTDGKTISWVRVFSWSKNQLFNIKLRDDILALDKLDVDKVISAFADNTKKHWVRRSMKEFEYLSSQIQPPTWAIVLATIFSIGVSGFLSFAFIEYDLDKVVLNIFKGVS
jgi:hypothetical protein